MSDKFKLAKNILCDIGTGFHFKRGKLPVQTTMNNKEKIKS